MHVAIDTQSPLPIPSHLASEACMSCSSKLTGQNAVKACIDSFPCDAELLDVLRISVETRKTQLVDAALDCVQKLISHGLLSGPVQKHQPSP